MFQVKNITKAYHDLTVVNGFSFDFKEGLYLLVGKNGSGKSTILKMLAKVITPSNKDYYISDNKIAYLCEKASLTHGYPCSLLYTIKVINQKQVNIFTLLNTWKIPNKRIENLSKGNKQKCAILMMLLANANVYLFDEPTDALDQESINLFKEAIIGLVNDKKTVIISTHEEKYFEGLNYFKISL